MVANDPYHGGGHLPDYNVFAPVFHDGECVLIASIQCHHADTGGGAPGGYNVNAPDIWAEGVRFPAVKIFEKGVKRADVEYMMAVNNRTPTFIGDLRAQVGAAQLGVRRLKEVLARFGTRDRAAPPCASIIAYAKRRFREEVARWPDGVYESDAYVDHDPHGKRDIHVHCKVTVAGQRSDRRLHRLRRPARHPGLLDLRQHARLRRGAARVDDGPDDPEERGLLRLDRADRARRAAA